MSILLRSKKFVRIFIAECLWSFELVYIGVCGVISGAEWFIYRANIVLVPICPNSNLMVLLKLERVPQVKVKRDFVGAMSPSDPTNWFTQREKLRMIIDSKVLV